LQRRYGPGEYQKIPDNYQGDAGIEGFTITSGHAYQAYGPEEPLTTDARYRKHRDKITDDIRKFIQNRDLLSDMLGSVKIKRWILIVPRFDSKELLRHAAKKTQEILDAKLPYVDCDFRVCIEDEEAFAVERNQLLNANLEIISIISDEVNSLQIAEWADKNDKLVQNLDDKISRLPTIKKAAKRRLFRDQMIKHFLEGQNAIEELRRYPTAYERIRQAKGQRERYLATEAMIATGSNSEFLNACLNQIRETIKSEVPGVADHTIEAIVWEAVSDWMIRCPLNFVQANSNG
jgi:hypothetical protein